MSGALIALDEANCALVGGHTCEGEQLGLGFAITGEAERDQVLQKGGMHRDDIILIIKSIGTGVILAADMRVEAEAIWKQAAIQSMLQSNQKGALLLRNHVRIKPNAHFLSPFYK